MTFINHRRVELSTSANIIGKPAIRSVRFGRQRDFRNAVNARVDAYLRDNHLPARDVPAMYLKTTVALAWWLGVYLLLLLGHFPLLIDVLLCVVWAMAIASVGFNVVHDANHSGFSDNPRLNRLIGFSAEMLGMSGFRWRVKHNVWHHTYTNISGFDDDVETYGLMRLTPRAPWRPLFKAQAWYFPMVYSLIGFDFIMRDFMMALIGKSDENHVYPKMSAADKVTFWVGKLFYFTIMLAVPLLVFAWWQVLIGFLIVMLTVGIIMGVVFQLAHISRDTAFPEPVGSPPHIDKEWAVHQVETTVDFAPHNWLLSLYIGGLNYQIEHHLLPHICHLNYPRLAPIVRATCEEFGVRYKCYATWREAFASHWHELRLLGRAAKSVRSS
jgi:linoleoyl-CoA desaturase